MHHLVLTLLLATTMTAAEPLRILALGDSITDGNTWPQIMMQSLRSTAQGTPVVICAGAGGDSTKRMGERLPALLAQLKPAVVLVQGGTNDALQKVPAADWLAAVRSIITTSRAGGAKVLIGTPCTIGDQGSTDGQKKQFAEPLVLREAYLAGLAALAKELDVPLAATGERMTEADRTARVMSGDGIHPNYHGQAAIARAWLDALGHTAAALPATFEPAAFPGLITRWQVRAAGSQDAWRELVVPEPAAKPEGAEAWIEQMRRNGFCLSLGDKKSVARTEIELPADAWLHIGGGAVESVSLDGKRLHARSAWHGYHLGAVRIPLAAAPGRHVLEVETGGWFAIAVTPGPVWEDAWR